MRTPSPKKDEMNWSEKISFVYRRDPTLLRKPYAMWDLDRTIEKILKEKEK